jgi:RNA methyltransferase, TrmH family
MSSITSADNKLFKLWHSLNAARGIERHGLALVSGRKIVPELAATASESATLLLREGDFPPPFTGEVSSNVTEADARASERTASPLGRSAATPPASGTPRTAMLARDLFDQLDEFGTHSPLLVLPPPPIATFDAAAPPSGLEVLVAAQDPANLGAILRSALAFGVRQVILLKECAHPFLPRVTRAAAGANFRTSLAAGPSIAALTQGAVALDLEGEPIDTFRFPQDCRLLLGEEGAGVPATFRDKRVRIPIGTAAESLNVAVAAGIALAAYRRAHQL